MIVAKVFEGGFALTDADVRHKVSDNTGFIVSGDMKDNLAFIPNEQLEWTAISYVIKGGVALFEISKCSFRNVSDLSDFRSGISVARHEPQGSTTSLGSPLESLHDWID